MRVQFEILFAQAGSNGSRRFVLRGAPVTIDGVRYERGRAFDPDFRIAGVEAGRLPGREVEVEVDDEGRRFITRAYLSAEPARSVASRGS